MDKEDFDLLFASAQEALSIAKGDKKPSRVFVVEVPDVKEIRDKTGLSQIDFAKRLCISPRTLQNWEQGRTNPTGPAQTLLRLLDKQPQLLELT